MTQGWWTETRGPGVAAREFFPPKHFSRRRWVGRIFTRKLSSCQLDMLLNFQGPWLDNSETHQKVTGKVPAEGRVL